ncbi:MAG: flagellar motor switch protein FliG, partial [Treponema sp.]
MAVSPAKEKSGSKKHKDVNSLTGRQKVAIFLISLGGEISAKVMEQLRED